MSKWGWIVVGLLFVNWIVLDIWVFGKLGEQKNVLGDRVEKIVETEVVEVEGKDECNAECVIAIVEEEIEAVVSKYGLTEKKITKVVSKTVSEPEIKAAVEKFVRLSGGAGQGSDWIRLGESVFWLDSSLYGELVEASWQGWVESSGGGLDGWVRLYDASNGRVVDGSETRITGLSKTSFYSKNIAIWRGQNQYYIEIKDVGGGDRLSVTEPRLRLMVR